MSLSFSFPICTSVDNHPYFVCRVSGECERPGSVPSTRWYSDACPNGSGHVRPGCGAAERAEGTLNRASVFRVGSTGAAAGGRLWHVLSHEGFYVAGEGGTCLAWGPWMGEDSGPKVSEIIHHPPYTVGLDKSYSLVPSPATTYPNYRW